MSATVLWVVLFAALLHALWNAAVKHGVGREVPGVAVFIGAGVAGGLIVPWVPVPLAASWPYLLGSVAAHAVYSVLLGRAYRAGDFSRTYPIMRGTPPLATLAIVGFFTTERLGAAQQAAMLVLCAGILTLLLENGLRRAAWTASVGWALVVAFTIAVYTSLDGIGGRLSQSPVGYVAWLCLIEALVLAALLAWRKGRAGLVAVARAWPLTLLGGATTLLSYGLVVWAMTQAPIALVAAARESSVVFAALLGVVFFRERLTPARIVAIVLVLAGLVAMRLS